MWKEVITLFVGVLSLCFVPCSSTECFEEARPRIVGGDLVNITEVPWQAFLFTIFGGAVMTCGAVFVSTKHVLTAAHCVYNATQGRIHAGDSDWLSMMSGSSGQVFNISRVTIHPEYSDGDIYHDIAVIHIDPELIPSDTVQTIALPRKESLPQELTGQRVWASGWGATEEAGSLSSSLRFVELHIIPTSICGEAYGKHENASSLLCAVDVKQHNGGICRGDSGGPITYWDGPCHREVLLGIASFRDSSCAKRSPTGFGRVDFFADWIKEVMEDE
ncbi:trypsin-7-like isoform X2 [Oratosquilla oratoria]|uniref:trypsin-7-like isoform X2 n=1 Tax=Oratosquilla oratoria TaxID=337810 RepID=UPI003F75C18A